MEVLSGEEDSHGHERTYVMEVTELFEDARVCTHFWTHLMGLQLHILLYLQWAVLHTCIAAMSAQAEMNLGSEQQIASVCIHDCANCEFKVIGSLLVGALSHPTDLCLSKLPNLVA